VAGFGKHEAGDGKRPGPISVTRSLSPVPLFLCALLLILLGFASVTRAQRLDVIGAHDLSPGGSSAPTTGPTPPPPSPILGTVSGSCLYCHAPHSGLNGTAGVVHTPLWDQKLSSVQSYTVYSSGTLKNTPNPSPPLGTDSTLCLSCHDGTVAGSPGPPGVLTPYGNVPMSGKMDPNDEFASLAKMHPISFELPLQAASNLVPSLTYTPPYTGDTTGAVKLINGNVECTSCHNPHVQNIDASEDFLVIDNSSSALCLSCHSTTPPPQTGTMGLVSPGHTALSTLGSPLTAKVTVNNPNMLVGWRTGIHATATNKVAPLVTPATSSGVSTQTALSLRQSSLGPHSSVSRNGCASCHTNHNAPGGTSLLRAVDDQTCLVCHNGSSNISPPIANLLAELVAPKYGHAFSAGNTPHRPNEASLLNQNLHVTCVDCHNPHAANRASSFPAAPGVRLSQTMVAGISATDGKTVVNPAANQYENCLRCHGTSTGKRTNVNFGYLPVRVVAAADPLNVIPEFSSFAPSSHPVFHDRTSVLPQPSLRPSMVNLDGRTLGRTMARRILCTDCHNSDDNREFGGSGPNGPHGSIFPHILERRYEFSQAPFPGKPVTNLFINPNLSAQGSAAGGPYALCAKCHDLNQIMSNTSFSEHARHVKQDGFSCSVCHVAHGMGSQSGAVSGERMVNFDASVVAPNGPTLISYNRSTNSCALVCHNHSHQLRTAGGKASFR